MAVFNYEGRNAKGSQVKGVIEAANTNAVVDLLARQQITPTAIEQSKSNNTDKFDVNNIDIGDLLGFSAVSLDDLIILCRQMYALMRAGVPILILIC